MKSTQNLILIVLAAGLFYAFTSPVYQDTKSLQASVAEYRNVLDNVSRITETRDALLENYQTIPRDQVERLAKILPNNVDAVRLALDLDTIGGRYGIAIKDVQVDTHPDQKASLAVVPQYNLGYETARVTFSFVSNYPNFTKFLADLEKGVRIMDVKSVSFKVSDSGLYEHTVTVETYWLK